MKNKICYLVLFVLLFSFLLGSQCFAVIEDNTIIHNGVEYFLHDYVCEHFSHYVICQYFDSYLIIFATSPITRSGAYFYGENITYNIGNTFEATVSQPMGLGSSNFKSFSSGEEIEIIYSNSNVYSTEGDLLFQLPSQVMTLAPIVKEVETEKTLSEVVEILPVVLVIIISFLGIRKALKFISTLLRRS